MGVRAVADGAAYLSQRIAQKVISQLSGGRMPREVAARKEIAVLTPRELDVLSMVGRGQSNQDIARELFVLDGYGQVARQRDPAEVGPEQPRPGGDPRLRSL